MILIELTCPCEENTEAWHNAKVNKYMPLKSVIENNGWNVDLFAVEVGARGYCSRSVLCCFKSLGLRNCTINTTIKQLSKCSMECSFCIWLARNNKAWFSKEIDLSLKTPEDPLAHQNPQSTTSKTPLPVGFINKGNTCYANAILQVLSVLLSLWIRVPSDLANQLIHQISYGPSLARSQSLVMCHLILTLSKMLLRYYSLSLMN